MTNHSAGALDSWYGLSIVNLARVGKQIWVKHHVQSFSPILPKIMTEFVSVVATVTVQMSCGLRFCCRDDCCPSQLSLGCLPTHSSFVEDDQAFHTWRSILPMCTGWDSSAEDDIPSQLLHLLVCLGNEHCHDADSRATCSVSCEIWLFNSWYPFGEGSSLWLSVERYYCLQPSEVWLDQLIDQETWRH